jgi:hypothetical protein
MNVLRIINEPTAAAIAYGLDKKVTGDAMSSSSILEEEPLLVILILAEKISTIALSTTSPKNSSVKTKKV